MSHRVAIPLRAPLPHSLPQIPSSLTARAQPTSVYKYPKVLVVLLALHCFFAATIVQLGSRLLAGLPAVVG